MSQFKPVKIIVQVVGVIEDDDGNLTEQATAPTTIPAKDWRGFAAEGGGFDTALDLLKISVSANRPLGDNQEDNQ